MGNFAPSARGKKNKKGEGTAWFCSPRGGAGGETGGAASGLGWERARKRRAARRERVPPVPLGFCRGKPCSVLGLALRGEREGNGKGKGVEGASPTPQPFPRCSSFAPAPRSGSFFLSAALPPSPPILLGSLCVSFFFPFFFLFFFFTEHL